LTDQDLSLHDVLRRHGYGVHLILGGDHTSFYGLRAAYGQVDSYFDGSMVRGRYVNDDELVLEHVRQLPPWNGRPVLMQFHLMSSHLLGKRDPALAHFTPSRPYAILGKGIATDLGGPLPETDNHYDNGVRQMDDVVRRLVALLTERNYLQDAVLVLTGDHGEMLGEHGEFGHAKGVFEPAMRVPLVFAGFGVDPPALDSESPWLASQLDIAPTLLRALDMPLPRTWAGQPLQGHTNARQLPFRQGHLVGVYDETEPGRTLKYWRHLRTGEEHVYDVDGDAAESRDLVGTIGADRLQTLRQAVLPLAASVAQ
jgi:hypothetical protein